MHMSIAIIVAFALTGSWKAALAIGLIEPCIQTGAYFFHERAWHRIEKKWHAADHHDAVINSVSPVVRLLEKILRHGH